MDYVAAWTQLEQIRQQRRHQAGIVADARQPVAYEAVSERGREAVYAADLKANAETACTANGWRLVPIYERSDLVQRLRDRAYAGKIPDSLSEEAADEIERLRARHGISGGMTVGH